MSALRTLVHSPELDAAEEAYRQALHDLAAAQNAHQAAVGEVLHLLEQGRSPRRALDAEVDASVAEHHAEVAFHRARIVLGDLTEASWETIPD